MDERSGLCFICGGLARPARSCSMCGAVVCGKCFDSRTGLCSKCAARARPRH